MIRTLSLIFFLTLTALKASPQDTVYYFGSDHRLVPSVREASFMKKIYYRSARRTVVKPFTREESAWKPEPKRTIKDPRAGGHLIIKVHDHLFAPETTNQYYREISAGRYAFREYRHGELMREGTASRMIPLILEDTVKEFYPSGQVKTVAIYHSNRLLSNKNWLRDGTPYIDNIFYAADQIPEYSNGNAFFRSFILREIHNAGIDLTQIDDRVVLGWVITETGELTGIHVVSGKFRELNQAMVNIVSELPGSWSPAVLDGKKVRYYMTIPFNFGQAYRTFDYLQLNSNGQLDWD